MANNNYNTKPMTVGDWFVTLLILTLPLINIVMYIFWAVDSTGNVNRRNFCRASILWFVILMSLSIVVLMLTGVASMLLGQ